MDLNFKATLDDNFFSVISLRYDAQDNSGTRNKPQTNTHGGLTGTNGSWGEAGADAFGIRQYYLGYTGLKNTTILLGRQTIASFFTDDVAGTGIKILATPLDGLMLGAFAFDNIEEDGDLLADDFTDKDDKFLAYAPYKRNLYGVAITGEFEPVSFQGWYALLQETAQLFAIDLGANFELSDDFGLNARLNLANTNLRNKFKKELENIENPAANSTFVGAELGANAFGFDISAGYLSYGKKDKTSLHTLEDKGEFITAGEQVLDYTLFSGKHSVWFAKLGYNYDSYFLGYEFVYDKNKFSQEKIKSSEHVIRASYEYNQKLNFETFYSIAKTKNNGIKDKFNSFRFDMVYNF